MRYSSLAPQNSFRKLWFITILCGFWSSFRLYFSFLVPHRYYGHNGCNKMLNLFLWNCFQLGSSSSVVFSVLSSPPLCHSTARDVYNFLEYIEWCIHAWLLITLCVCVCVLYLCNVCISLLSSWGGIIFGNVHVFWCLTSPQRNIINTHKRLSKGLSLAHNTLVFVAKKMVCKLVFANLYSRLHEASVSC